MNQLPSDEESKDASAGASKRSDTASNAAPRVVIVGGGVIGAFCAWELSLCGWAVTIVDQNRFGAACSHGNCGFVCPSHVLPLPAPGAVGDALKTMFRPKSPLKIRLRASPELWKWMWNFASCCKQAEMLDAGAARHELLQSSLQLYKELVAEGTIDFEWQERGLLMVHHDARHFEEFATTDEMMRAEFGFGATPYDSAGLEQLEPALKPGLGGAWHYERDCHLRPDKLMAGLRKQLERRGATIREHCKFQRIARGADRSARAIVDDCGEEIAGDAFVFAAGALSPLVSKEVGCKIPIQPGKGYSITTNQPAACPRLPMIFEAHRVAVTPFESAYRLGSTMEFAGYDTTLNSKRLQLLHDGASHYLDPTAGEQVAEQWYGWRPMTWDGKPLIGRTPRWKNVLLATGHNMLGLSMAPATGRLIRELLEEQPPHLDITPFAPDRFS